MCCPTAVRPAPLAIQTDPDLPPCPCCGGALFLHSDDGDTIEVSCVDCVRFAPAESE